MSTEFLIIFIGGWIGVFAIWRLNASWAESHLPTRHTLRPCPRCAELIQPAASICRYCGLEVEPLPIAPPASRKAGSSPVFKAVVLMLVLVVAVMAIGLLQQQAGH